MEHRCSIPMTNGDLAVRSIIDLTVASAEPEASIGAAVAQSSTLMVIDLTDD
jgi:hypothetical protein